MDNIIKFSEIISPIFYKLVYMSIKAMIIGLIIFILLKIFKKFINPRIRYMIWFIFIIMLLIPIEFKNDKLYSINFENNIQSVIYFQNSNNVYEYFSNNASEDVILEKEYNSTYLNFKSVIPIIWLIILIFEILYFIIAYEMFNKKLNKYKDLANDRISNILERCKTNLKIKQKIDIIYHDFVKVPSLFGINKCKILLNKDIILLTDSEIEKVILHELTHYKRYDNLVNILINSLILIYIFNPIVIILLNNIKNEMEFTVDEQILKNKAKDERNEYCKILIKLSAEKNYFLNSKMYFMNDKKLLNERIAGIKSNFSNKLIKLISVIFTICILIVFIIILCNSNQILKINDISKILEKGKYSQDKIQIINIKYNLSGFKVLYCLNSNNYNIIDNNENKCNSNEICINLLNEEKLTYKYLKNEYLNNCDCGVISLYYKSENTFISYDYWIDLTTGVILKERYYYNNIDNIKPKNCVYEVEYAYS